MSPTESDKLDNLIQGVTRIETALFGAADGDEGFVKTTRVRLNDHAKRVKSLEMWRYGVTVAVGVLLWLFSHHVLTNAAETFHEPTRSVDSR